MSDFSEIGGVPVLGFISPADTRDEYAVTDPLYAIGGFRIIEGGLTDLNLIPEARRRAGMIVGIRNGEKYYKLLNKEWIYDLGDWETWRISDNPDPFNSGTQISGTKLFTNRLIQVTSNQSTFNITLDDDSILVNIKCNEDYNIILPPLNSINLGFKIAFKNLTSDGLKGTIYPYSGDIIEGKGNFNFFGKGLFEITKMLSVDGVNNEWVLTHYSNIIESRFQGKTKKFEFINKSQIIVPHNLGYTPVTQVWIGDGLGDYNDADVDVDHDLINYNTFNINFGQPLSGFVLFI
tara:strand:- start:6181 stop:7056 length:876 start_codon:yes stop_codon:yes gene_type:complete